MTCLLLKSNGELLFLGFGHATDLITISYANRAAWFISAYGQGLSSLEAAWATQIYQKCQKNSTAIKHCVGISGGCVTCASSGPPYYWYILIVLFTSFIAYCSYTYI